MRGGRVACYRFGRMFIGPIGFHRPCAFTLLSRCGTINFSIFFLFPVAPPAARYFRRGAALYVMDAAGEKNVQYPDLEPLDYATHPASDDSDLRAVVNGYVSIGKVRCMVM